MSSVCFVQNRKMHIKINHLKSIGSTLDFTLRNINFFIGPNAGGKSVLPELIQLFKRNDALKDFRKRQFPTLTHFDHQEDWCNWAHLGQTNKASTIVRSVSFLSQKVNLIVKLKASSALQSKVDHEWKCAQVETITIQDGQMTLLIWGAEMRRINTRQLAMYLYKAIKNYGHITPSDWEEEMNIPMKQGVHLTLEFLQEYIENGPEYYEDDSNPFNFFFLDIQALFFRQRLSVAYRIAFEPITALMEKILLSFQQSMVSFLIDSPVLKGERKPRWEEGFQDRKNQYAQEYFGFSIEQQKITNEDGSFYDREIFVRHSARSESIQKCSEGIQVVCSWIEEWTEAVDKMRRQSDSLFFSAEKVFFIQNPERHLHPEWQVKLLRMMLDDIQQHSNWKIVIETHSQVLIEEVIRQVSAVELDKGDVALFEFNKDETGQTNLRKVGIEGYQKEKLIHSKVILGKIGLSNFGFVGLN